MADLDYKGFHQVKSKLLIPIKKPKNLPLPQRVKQINQEISRRRISIEVFLDNAWNQFNSSSFKK